MAEQILLGPAASVVRLGGRAQHPLLLFGAAYVLVLLLPRLVDTISQETAAQGVDLGDLPGPAAAEFADALLREI